MSLDITKKVTGISYNGIDFPISGGGQESKIKIVNISKSAPIMESGTSIEFDIDINDPDITMDDLLIVCNTVLAGGLNGEGPMQYLRDQYQKSFGYLGSILYMYVTTNTATSHVKVDFTGFNTKTTSVYDLNLGVVTKDFKYGDSLEFSYYMYSCFAENTQIMLSNKTTKLVQDITYDDELLVWDLWKGDFNTAKPYWIAEPSTAHFYWLIKFSDGNFIKTVGNFGHRLYNKTKNKFLYTDDCKIGDEVYTLNGITTITSIERVYEPIKYYNLKTEKYLNCFANNILTGQKFNNLFEIKDMKYISNKPLFTKEEIIEHDAKHEEVRLPGYTGSFNCLDLLQ